MGIEVQFDVRRTVGRLQAPLGRAQVALDVQVLKDSNYFCPEATGNLQTSGVTGTVPGSGQVRWNSPYARRQYYEFPNKSHDRNPNARMRWFDEAKTVNLKDWERIAQAALNG